MEGPADLKNYSDSYPFRTGTKIETVQHWQQCLGFLEMVWVILTVSDLWRGWSSSPCWLTVKEAFILTRASLAKGDAHVPVTRHGAFPLEALITQDQAGGEREDDGDVRDDLHVGEQVEDWSEDIEEESTYQGEIKVIFVQPWELSSMLTSPQYTVYSTQ